MIARSTARAARRDGLLLLVLSAGLVVAGVMSGSEGWAFGAMADAGLQDVLWQIRLPRTLGAWLTGALLGLAGAVSQGLFRNPLADPFLLGSAAGAQLAVVLVLAAAVLGGVGLHWMAADLFSRLGLTGAAFAGALGGVLLTLALARGLQRGTGLLLAGVVVGVMLNAVGELVTMVAPDTLRGRQAFLLGSTGFLGWGSCGALALAWALVLPASLACSRALDALSLGEDSAHSLGLPLRTLQRVLVVLLALATGAAVAQSGLIAFVGLVAPHLVRSRLHAPHAVTLAAASATGGTLLLASDLLARTLAAPNELPVGVLTALLGGGYLLMLLRKGFR